MVFAALPEQANGAAGRFADSAAQRQRGADQRHDRIAAPQRNEHVADGETPAPDRIDHGMVRCCGRISEADRRIGAEMLRQLERELHARREFRKTLVDTELEEEGAIPMAQHDARGDRHVTG